MITLKLSIPRYLVSALNAKGVGKREVTAYSFSAASHLKLLNDYLPVNLIVISDREKKQKVHDLHEDDILSTLEFIVKEVF